MRRLARALPSGFEVLRLTLIAVFGGAWSGAISGVGVVAGTGSDRRHGRVGYGLAVRKSRATCRNWAASGQALASAMQHECTHHHAGVHPAHHPQAQRAAQDPPAGGHDAHKRRRGGPACNEGDRPGVELAAQAGIRGGGNDIRYCASRGFLGPLCRANAEAGLSRADGAGKDPDCARVPGGVAQGHVNRGGYAVGEAGRGGV
jgi:hypothetical protein